MPAQTPRATKVVTATKLIVATAFDQDTPLIRKKPIHGWSAAIGQWQVKDGVLIRTSDIPSGPRRVPRSVSSFKS